MILLASLIREFPVGAFLIIMSIVWAFERMAVSFINRNKPVVQCDCCEEADEKEEEE